MERKHLVFLLSFSSISVSGKKFSRHATFDFSLFSVFPSTKPPPFLPLPPVTHLPTPPFNPFSPSSIPPLSDFTISLSSTPPLPSPPLPSPPLPSPPLSTTAPMRSSGASHLNNTTSPSKVICSSSNLPVVMVLW